MYFTICQTADNSDQQITEFITAGFSGQPKGWWDHYITPLQKVEILSAIKLEPITQQHREDAVYSLITTILHHFVGDTKALK